MKHTTFRNKTSALILITYVGLTTWAHSQDISPPQSFDIFLDNRSDSLRSSASAANEATAANVNLQRATLLSGFLTNFVFTPSYGFLATVSKTGNGKEMNTNSIGGDISADYSNLWTFDTNIAWKNTFGDNNQNANVTNANNVGISFQPAWHVLNWYKSQPWSPYRGSNDDDMTLGIVFGYQHTDMSSLTKAVYSINPSNAYSISPAISYTHLFFGDLTTDSLVLNVATSYMMQWTETGGTGSSAGDTNHGTFLLQNRLDYGFAGRNGGAAILNGCILEATAIFSHDINQKVLSGQPDLYQGWGDFGAAVRYTLPKTSVYIKIGYDFTAFRSDKYANSATATMTIPF